VDSELRQRATATTFFHQSTLGCGTYGKHRADRVLFDKMQRPGTAMNTAGIGETEDIPVTDFVIVQGQVIATEYGNAVEWTEKLDTFSQWSVGDMVAAVLRQDQIEGLDKVAYAAYALGRVIYTPLTASSGSFSTTGTAAAVGGSQVTVAHVKDISDYMRTNKIPGLSSGDYVAIVHVDHARGIKDSTEFIDVSKYHMPERLYDSELGKYAGVRFLEENNVLISPAGTSTVTAQGVYFGSDNVIEAVAVGPHLRQKIPQLYGRDRGEAHFYMGGFAQVWSFNTDGGEEHQVRVDSL
jgi:N4-gp56 family major capsid protein